MTQICVIPQEVAVSDFELTQKCVMENPRLQVGGGGLDTKLCHQRIRDGHNLSPAIKCDSDLPQKESECGVGLFHGEPELVGHGLELKLLLADLAAKCCTVLVARLLREQLGQVLR